MTLQKDSMEASLLSRTFREGARQLCKSESVLNALRKVEQDPEAVVGTLTFACLKMT